MKNPEFQNSPYIVHETAGKRFYCRCGKTNNQPFCDGSHKGTGITPMVVDIEKDRRVAYCGCRQSGELPFCDGTHSTL